MQRSLRASRSTICEQVKAAAETGAELARSMVAAGNWNRLDESREQIFYPDAGRSGCPRRNCSEDAAREKLAAADGPALGARPAFQLAERLPELPQNIESLPDVEATVLQNRIDLQMQRLQIDELRRSLKLTKATRFVNVLDAGPTRVQQGTGHEPYETGYEVSLEVPIFDGGGARVKRAQAIYAQAVDRLPQAADRCPLADTPGLCALIARASTSRDSSATRWCRCARRSRSKICCATTPRSSVFLTCSPTRAEQIVRIDEYIQSVRDFWIAKSELDAALARQLLQ